MFNPRSKEKTTWKNEKQYEGWESYVRAESLSKHSGSTCWVAGTVPGTGNSVNKGNEWRKPGQESRERCALYGKGEWQMSLRRSLNGRGTRQSQEGRSAGVTVSRNPGTHRPISPASSKKVNQRWLNTRSLHLHPQNHLPKLCPMEPRFSNKLLSDVHKCFGRLVIWKK